MPASTLRAPVLHRESLAHSHAPTIHAHHDAAIEHVMRSNMPAEKKAAAIRGYWDGLQDRLHALAPSHPETDFQKSVAQAGSLVRQDAVAGLTGYGIAYLEHVLGKLDVKGVPLDAILSGVSGVAAVASPYLGIEMLSPELRTVSSTALGICTYRKGKEHLSSTTPHVRGETLADLANEL